MFEKTSVLDGLWPGRTAGGAPDLRPLLRRGLHRRLHMFSMLGRVRPNRCDDPAGFAALLSVIEGRPDAWRERFFDDVEVAAWVMGLGQASTQTDASPVSIRPFRTMVEEHDSDGGPARGYGHRPHMLAEDGPPNLLAAVARSFAKAGEACAVSRLSTKRQRLQSRVVEQWDALAIRWPEMAAMARQHIAAIVVVDHSCSVSNGAFPGVVVWGEPNICETTPGLDVDFGEYIVHETIHQVLYCLQEVHPLLSPGVVGSFKSPWSGRIRPLAVASHVPLVYFAILEYLRRSSMIEPKPRVLDRMRRIAAGMDRFHEAEVGRPYMTSWGRALHDQIWAAFDARRCEFLA